MKQFCEKQQQISVIQNIVNEITKMLDEAELKKKKCEQINNLKEEISFSADMIRKEFLELLEKSNKEKWIIGEYKWMPAGSSMPEGWFKVAIEEGLTLVQGLKKGITEGKVQVHQHFHDPLWDDKGSWVVRNFKYYGVVEGNDENSFESNSVPNQDDGGVAFQTADHGNNLNANQKQNLAAGLYAELWQYKGIDYEKKSFNKCIYKYISQLINKFENCKKDQMELEFLQPEERHINSCC